MGILLLFQIKNQQALSKIRRAGPLFVCHDIHCKESLVASQVHGAVVLGCLNSANSSRADFVHETKTGGATEVVYASSSVSGSLVPVISDAHVWSGNLVDKNAHLVGGPRCGRKG